MTTSLSFEHFAFRYQALTPRRCYSIFRSPLDGAGPPPPVPPGGNGPLVHGEVVDLRNPLLGLTQKGYEESLLPHPLPPGPSDVLSRCRGEARERSRSVPRHGRDGLPIDRSGHLTKRLHTLVWSFFSWSEKVSPWRFIPSRKKKQAACFFFRLGIKTSSLAINKKPHP